MQQLPSNDFFTTTGPRPNVGEFTAAWEAVRDFVAQLWGAAKETSVTLASDVLTITQARHIVAAQTGTADNLAQIAVTDVPDGFIVEVQPDSGDTITVKHNTGTNKLLLADAVDFVMSDPSMRLWLRLDTAAGTWTEVKRSYGGNKTAFVAWLGLTIGTLVQGYSAILAMFAGLTAATNKLPYFSSAITMATTDFTSYARTLLALTDLTAWQAALGISTSSGIPTGFTGFIASASAPSGWVMADGRTIGDASSAATNRANADVETLFKQLWNDFANAECPVVGGRGANASADWAAHKQITLPDGRDRVVAGKGNMGGTAANRLTNQTGGVEGDTLGASGGAETHALTTAQMPAHQHTFDNGPTAAGGTAAVAASSAGTTARNTSSVGGGAAHNNVQPTLILNMIIKL